MYSKWSYQELDSRKKIGKRLKELRDNRNLTQAQLAAFFEMGVPDISKLENGHRDLTLRLLDQYCQFFNKTAFYILHGDAVENEINLNVRKGLLEKMEELNSISKELADMASELAAQLMVE